MATKKTTTKKKADHKKKQQPRKKASRKMTAAAAVAAPEPRQIVATPELAKGVYCNIANVKHTEREFVMDFILGVEHNFALVSRVITNPAHMKMLVEVFAGNVANYEKAYGEIDTGTQDKKPRKTH